MRTPLQDLAPVVRWCAFAVLLLGVVAVGRAMAPSLATMKAHGPGIVPFELAGPAGTERILRQWGPAGVAAAREQLRLDYVWLVFYAGAFAVGCVAVGEALGGSWATAGAWLSWAALLAGLLDVVENTALLAVLDGKMGAARVAQLAAVPKFALAVPAGIFSLSLVVAVVVRVVWNQVQDRSVAGTG